MHDPIAVIGMGCRFPGGANTPEAFWRLLRAGVDAVVPIPAWRWDVAKYYDPDRRAAGKMYVREGGFLKDEEITHFDSGFFRMAPRETASLDPQQRLLLEVSWEALENAGQAPAQLEGSRTGVFVGSFWDDYPAERFYLAPLREVDAFTALASLRSMAAGRIAHALNVHGPTMQLDCACSSSLVAVHLACQALRNAECELALAGGVSMMLSPRLLIGNSRMNALATTGRCRTFAAGTDGFGRGEGCGVVVLKRYADAVRDGDNVLAIVRGSAVNHGGRGLSLTTPNPEAQKAVLRAALANAGVEPAQIQYVEAHGTGTPLGDPIEMDALGQVFGPAREKPLLVGSVKTNIGHLDAAAGASGLIKVVLALQHGEIPPNLHFDKPNPMIRWDRIPVTVPAKLTAWDAERKLAGVSAFGLSGTNAHVVVEEAARPEARPDVAQRPFELLTLSAKSPQALHDLAVRYSEYLGSDCRALLADICHTAAVGRSHFEHRVALLANSTDQLREQMRCLVNGERAEGIIRLRRGQEPGKPRVAFLFTGQGSQYVNMGRQLYQTHALFRRVLDQCDAVLQPLLGESLVSALDDAARLSQTIYAQPALFAIECALAEVWRSWGIEPDVVIGHSTGEYAAACVAGVFGIEDGIKLVFERARLIESVSGSGATAAALVDAARVQTLIEPLGSQVGIAGLNGPLETLIAGEDGPVDAAIAVLTAAGIECRRLQIPHAPHSPLMDPILDEFEAIARQFVFRAPRCRFVSNVTGRVIECLDANYWRRHLREPVRFMDGMAQLEKDGCNVMLEVGPQPVLQLLGRQNWRGAKGVAWLSSLWSVNDDWAQLLQSAGELYVRGAALDWKRFEREAGSGASRRKVPLPTYPFQRERQWVDAPDPAGSVIDETHHPLLGRPVPSAALNEGESMFESALSAKAPAYLKDHRAYEQVLLPASAFLEMAIALGRQQAPDQPVVVEDVSFQRALVLDKDGAGRKVQCLASPAREGLRWRVFSSGGDSAAWTLHAEGSVRSGAAEERLDSRVLLHSMVDPATLYNRFEQANLQYGASFRLIRKLWRDGDRALGEIQLSSGLVDESNQYSLHPALLDACLQVSAALFLDEADAAGGDEVYLPTGIERFTYQGGNRQNRLFEVTCAAHLRAAESGSLSIDLKVRDKGGALVAAIQGLQVRKVSARNLAGGDEWRNWLYQVNWQVQELSRTQARTDQPAHWLMITDSEGLLQNCAERLVSNGDRVTVVAPMNVRLQSIPPVTGVVFDAESADCGHLLHLIQALADRGTPPPLYIVTKGAVACGPQQPLAGLAQSCLWGMAKVVPLEYPEWSCVCIDLDPNAGPEEAAALLATELSARTTEEEQIAYRQRLRYVARLAPLTPEPPQPRRKPAQGEIEVELHASGLNFRDVLTALKLYPGDPGAMGLEGAGIVVATGAGVGEFSVGDRVMVIGPGCFARYLTVNARLAVRIPDGLTDIEAATIPSAFVTAWHCLRHLAGIRPGDRVLIHTATGGIGHAAIQIAQLAGAEIYATASPAKWPTLEALGVRHIYNSRTLAFGKAILADTSGQGVDVVLNTLTAQGFIDASLAALREGGCFLEISKRDVYSAAQMRDVRPGVAYHLVDQAEILVKEPDLVAAQLRELAELFAQRKLAPIPQTVFAMRDTASAFRTMEQATHVGKIVLVHPRSRSVEGTSAGRPERPPQAGGPPHNDYRDSSSLGDGCGAIRQSLELDASATYLITGGTGGLGLVIARGLVERGARRLLLVSRNAPSPGAQRQLDEMRQMGATVQSAQVDVSDAAGMAALLGAVPSEHPLRGVIHAAGLLDDGLLANQTTDRLARVMASKVGGAWNLHRLTEGLALDFFVLFSSASSLLGLAGQGNYAAANAYLDALAHHRHALGLPALAINWGVWAEVGSAAAFVPQLKRIGLEAIQPRQGSAILEALLGEDRPQVGVVPINWNRFDTRRAFLSGFRRANSSAMPREVGESLLPELDGKSNEQKKALLAAHIQREVASILRYASTSAVSTRQGFRELGLDSLTSMELRNRLQNALECQLPAAVIFNHPNVEALASYLVDSSPEIDAPVAPEPESHTPGMRERFVTAGGLQLCVCEWGPADGGLVVCVHGTRDQGASWEGVAAVLEADGCRVIAPDLRGHGRSDHGGPASRYQLHDFVSDLAQIIDELGGPVTLVGHSLGSIVAVLYATAHPETVEKLILVEPPLSPMAEDTQTFAQQMTAHLRADDGVRRHAIMPDVAAAAERLRQLTPSLSPETALRRAQRLTVPQGEGVQWRWDARFDGQAQVNSLFAGLERKEFVAMLAALQVPLSVIYGDASGWISAADKAQIQRACPALDPIVLPGGHNVHLDSPVALAQIVLGVLEDSNEIHHAHTYHFA